MSLKPHDFSQVPESTAELVRRNPRLRKCPYVLLRDKVGPLFTDPEFAALYESPRGRPAEAPAVLAVVLILEFIEDIDDRDAALAIITRVDWKYLLGLAWEDPGFDSSVLSEFRERVAGSPLVELFLGRVVALAEAAGLLKKRGAQRTDSTHVAACTQLLNRLECVGRTFQAALNRVALIAPRWLASWMPTEAWAARYQDLLTNYHLPKDATERRHLAETIGWDGIQLLEACYASDAPKHLRELEAIEMLRRVWIQQYYRAGARLRLRHQDELPPHAQRICSPFDPEARYSTKRDTHWLGYKVHVTETCDPDQPRLITHVATTPSTTNDQEVTLEIHADLAAHGHLPSTHAMDTGYVTADILGASARDYGVEIIGPVPPDASWQAHKPGGYTLAAFAVDWEAQRVTCPQGVTSSCWASSQHPDYSEPVIHVRFPRAACDACSVREHCTRAQKDGRTLTFLSQPAFTAQQTRREEQQTLEFWERYKVRAGIEGTLSQGVRAFGMRRARYRGLDKVHLQHVLTTAAMNLMRMVDWWLGHQPRGTRVSPFAALVAATT